MKETKFENIFFTLAWILFIIGIIVSSILMINFSKLTSGSGESNWMSPLFMLPIGISTVLCDVLLFVYLFFKRKYFVLIKMHVQKKWMYLTYVAVAVLVFNQVVVIIMGICAYFLNLRAIENYYMYVLIAISMLINMVAVILNTISKFMIKVDITIKRRGQEFNDDQITKIIKEQTEKTIDHTKK
ncbi:hypothetical protein [Malacoplasma iowae]|uniref:Uncharacterized protein n=1 Tax=Malacoplasma iowae 695 TaxID=1048830 RepID=A0A6P1LM73_MALIO|nr:hypothetical protein [Malacoplasma iowae]VEU61953.1 Uncharacterised protein [Mycoplasmopsis fermentans]EGZ31119.1 hypothetical protein GUU_03676 [Malacoplasma iowae 695]QHG90043.1 hypothetical protein EER00_04080 [Malacoplasma iowae 695]WPL36226.1 hypothetical protein QX180_02295 [Malacoplasma iowae]VEU70768.1 Uncharacterised protein [Malacoplasma iowae]